jgi:hypothetical protein
MAQKGLNAFHAAFSATVHDQKSEALHHPLQEICTDQ